MIYECCKVTTTRRSNRLYILCFYETLQPNALCCLIVSLCATFATYFSIYILLSYTFFFYFVLCALSLSPFAFLHPWYGCLADAFQCTLFLSFHSILCVFVLFFVHFSFEMFFTSSSLFYFVCVRRHSSSSS